ncbi:hypothetical protein HELRODRAFT_77714 [Helobdella robusta]|uniref:Sphingomyelin phosphodiesterase n=1 Tax=Helobdella robusta TaxID=6412 RepID=T1G329_HELRO|nr:hypothetical protein HELRODRAFT_77714 [Helobdella robusta]ESO05258.1 hypothetical protein HELRODRAFT_77714 [Helobdella robusta]
MKKQPKKIFKEKDDTATTEIKKSVVHFEESTKLSYRSDNLIAKEEASIAEYFECLNCKLAVGLIKTLMKAKVPKNVISNIVTSGCVLFNQGSHDVCHGVVSMFKNEVFEVLSNITISPLEVCEVLLTKNCTRKESKYFQWDVDLPVPSHDRTAEKNLPMTKPTPKLKVLQLTDIHIDFLYKPQSAINCNDPLCCRNGQPTEPSNMAGYWASLGACDMPTWTVDDLFNKLSKEKFDYILWTGDSLSHNVWNQTRDDQLKVLHYIAQRFDKYFPNIPVFPALGNHEGVPVNSFPFAKNMEDKENPMSWLYETMKNISSKPNEDKENPMSWLYETMKNISSKWGGYYTMQVIPGFRIVSLNMNFCNNLNGWLLLNPIDPSSEMKWLVDVLQEAEDNNEKVHIIGHIAPGLPECMQVWSRNYYKVINRFHKIISAQFFGHLHYDTFQLFYDLDLYKINTPTSMRTDINLKPISVAYLSPSLTTFININPGYRVFHLDGFHDESTWSVLDHETYIMNITLSNTLNQTIWVKEYSAKEAYQLESLSPLDWHDLILRMEWNATLFNFYFKNYFKSNMGQESCDAKCKMYMLCSLASGKSYDDEFCQHIFKHSTAFSNFRRDFQYSEYTTWYKKLKSC